MKPGENPNWFANNPLSRLNNEKDNGAFITARLAHADSLIIPLWRGDPLIVDGKAGFLSAAALSEFPKNAAIVFLGLMGDTAYFGVDASAASSAETAPFADIGTYTSLRMTASDLSRGDLAIIGHARWLFEWHRNHQFCAVCGVTTHMQLGGAKRQCPSCETDHFPRSDPVAIVLALHDGACLLGRGPTFPEGVLSALAGYVEAGETPEEAAKRELFEEAGITLTDVRYQFSQPWPFPCSMMMGFIADAQDRALTLDTNEIVEAKWLALDEIRALLNGEERSDLFIPPKFTIARQLLEVWAKS